MNIIKNKLDILWQNTQMSWSDEQANVYKKNCIETLALESDKIYTANTQIMEICKKTLKEIEQLSLD